jgi:hypothetical protein
MKMKVVQRDAAGRTRRLWTYRDVRLTGVTLTYPNVVLATEGECILPIVETTMSLGIGSVYETQDVVLPPLLPSTGVYEDPVFFFVYNTDNYFHYLYDALPILSEFFRLRESHPTLKLLMNPAHEYPYIRDCLELLGLADCIVRADRETLYKTVYVASSPTHDGCPNDPPRNDVWDVYIRMKQAAFANPIPTPPKFYVSRRSWIHGDTSNLGTNYTTRRKLVVEDELVDLLAKHGYAEVFCEKLTMAEKIQYFANATHVVGAIGGGMCNLVFSPPTCRVVSLNSPEFAKINRRFLYTMVHTQLTQFTETYPVSGLYRRVRIGDQIGEIIEQIGPSLLVRTNPSGVTFQNEDAFQTIVVDESAVVYLDGGLNSPWSFHVDGVAKYI